MEIKNYDELVNLVERSKNVVVCSVDQDGFPNAKAMFNRKSDKLNTFYFSTNVSAKRTTQFSKNANASIYFFDQETFQGLMLVGKMTVCTDRKTKAVLWQEGDEVYYPAGIDDEDYCVLKFEAKKGNYYHGLENFNFEI
ncbi:pyridoxamine 5'-phosphate oxidase family protein [Clostridium oryzae]|uniref:Pyridoxamine 5'-phosphate oxidase n=1 Tax=Clostridium oryzae TaxID=1450648 RepID=A0A1V4I544_9CLOT|nr:pyridoxamine 5'-phosphate oxidase family protein [Clostridium oryzae]OPJ55108.1 pyridoxamine 5'-phosphate oxidase [Clostridium oryzae]